MPSNTHILSFRTRLVRLAVLTSGLAVLLTLLATVAARMVEVRREITTRLQAQAQVLAANSTAALLFEDAEAARSTLDAVKFVDGIDECHLYDKKGKRLASYVRGGDGADSAPGPQPAGARFSGLVFQLNHPVVFDGDEVGLLQIQYDLRADAWRLAGSLLMVLLMGGLALIVAYLLAGRLQRALSRPISELERAVARVADRRDYTVRAQKFSEDELGKLTDGVNEMLRQIELRDWALEEHRAYLEKRVQDRTTELSGANEALQTVNEELIKAMEESQRLAKLAETASRAKSSFLANMSHEIRTPATAIVGYIDLMRRRRVVDPAQSREWLERIRHNADHLVMLVNDLLDISKIEAGQMHATIRPCSLQGLLRQIESVMTPFAERKQVGFSIWVEGAVPQAIYTDQVRLKQILLNLVNNAIKFTDSGGTVKVAVQTSPDVSGDRRRLMVTVADSGIGIEPEKLAEIFQPFTQVFDPGRRNYGGAGLGLNISQKLAHLLGGRIRVTSEANVGTTFTLLTDVGAVEETPLVDPSELVDEKATEEQPGEAADLSDYRVLVADDNPDNQQIIRFFLTETGLDLRMVTDGRQAVDAFEEARAAGRPFDLVLMDMQMPVLDGYGATQELRRLGHSIPIVALTAFALAEDRQRCLDAGCDDHVAKPIDPAVLLSTVQKFLLKKNAGAGEKRPAESGAETLLRELEFILEDRRRAEAGELLRHLEKIRAVAAGQGYQEIERSAEICVRAVQGHRKPAELEAALNELIGIMVAAAPRSG